MILKEKNDRTSEQLANNASDNADATVERGQDRFHDILIASYTFHVKSASGANKQLG